MDTDYRIDVGEVKRSIDFGEVVALYFPLLRKTLLMDTRSSSLDAPMIKVVPMAASLEERARELHRLRPRFPKPERITIIPWPKYLHSLVEAGVYEHIVRRFVEIGPREIVRHCESCLRELQGLEREEIRRAIVGEDYETLWDASGSHEEEEAEVDDEDDDGI